MYFFQIIMYQLYIRMAFTRFHDDKYRLKAQAQDSSFSGRYNLDVPGPGINLPFFEDPQLRIQKWGANLQTNTINLENELFGLTKKLGCHSPDDNYKNFQTASTMPIYPTTNPTVEDSRATHPAWMYRDLEHPRWELPLINPQANLEKRFQDNIQTRILEKDYFTYTVPVLYELK
jgi:hypothetical protein